jgi:aminomethyltransferase
LFETEGEGIACVARTTAAIQSFMLSEMFAARGIAQWKLPSGGSVPLRFSDPVEEHIATRRGAGVFDFSFMGGWSFHGPQALQCLQRLQTRDLRSLKPGRILDTLLCRDDGSVLVDATLWCLNAQDYSLFSGRRSDYDHVVSGAKTFDVDVATLSDAYAVIAVQGPASASVLARTLAPNIATLPYFSFRRHGTGSAAIWIGRLGYTGELGYEVLLPAEHAAATWRSLTEVLTEDAPSPLECGMDAANSLRIEAGYIHFAFELGGSVLPAEIGLSRLVRRGGGDFVGRDALLRMGIPRRRLTGIAIDRPVSSIATTSRANVTSLAGVASRTGVSNRWRNTIDVTSEAYSPIFDRVLGLGYVDPALETGTIVRTQDGRRGRLERLPFRDPMRLRVRQAAAV